jgi:hypothetical protein
VGSIPIHPRHFSAVLAAMTAKMTAKITYGYLKRKRPWFGRNEDGARWPISVLLEKEPKPMGFQDGCGNA